MQLGERKLLRDCPVFSIFIIKITVFNLYSKKIKKTKLSVFS